MSFTSFAVFLTIGLLSGLLAGMFGIGGGIVIVPAMLYALGNSTIALDLKMPVTVATSLAVIAITGLSSANAHHKRGGVNWQMMKIMAPGCMLGTVIASFAVTHIPGKYLLGLFALFEFYIATDLLFGTHPIESASKAINTGLFLVAGLVIGAISTLLGIGGGSLTVPFLHYVGRPLREAVGTSSVFGAFLAIIASMAFFLQPRPPLPHTAGFIYLPAFFGIALASIVTAPLGAALAHRLPVKRLRQLLAIVLYLVALDMGMECLKHF